MVEGTEAGAGRGVVVVVAGGGEVRNGRKYNPLGKQGHL